MKTLIILLLILFLPIPFFFGVFYDEENHLFFKSYGLKIDFSTIFRKLKNISKKRKEKISKKEEKKAKNKLNGPNLIKSIYFSLSKSYLKPYMFISFYNEFGVEDAAIEGILYGLIHAILSIPFTFIKNLFIIYILPMHLNLDLNVQFFLPYSRPVMTVEPASWI